MIGTTTRAVARLATIAAGIAAVAAPLDDASAQAAAKPYPSKTITIVVGTGAGGGYAIAAQLLGRYWPEYIPGKPTVIVQAMPGGGGLKMAGWLHHVAPRDGSVIGMPVQTVALAQVLQPKDVKYDVHGWQWIGNMAILNQSVVVKASSPVRTMEEARKRQVVIGATARGGNLFATPQLTKELAGARFKIILGYRGTADMDKAMESNEIEGRGGTWLDWKLRYPDWKKGDKIIPLVITGMKPDPEAPNVPLLRDLVKDPLDKQVVDLFGYTDEIARPFAAVPKTPRNTVEMLRTSFEAAMKNKNLMHDAQTRGIPFEPTDWRAVEKSVLETVNVSPKVVARMNEVLAR
jgi:tripartite-type tricarboxylate transporter receptor subunit TctC